MNTELTNSFHREPKCELRWTTIISIATFFQDRYMSIVDLFFSLQSLKRYRKF